MESTNKISDIKFDVQRTLLVIENFSSLDLIFRKNGVDMGYPELHVMNKNQTLPEKVKGLLKEIFKQLILRQEEFIEKYEELIIDGDEITEEIIDSDTVKPEEPAIKIPKPKKFRLNLTHLKDLEGNSQVDKIILDTYRTGLNLRNGFEKVERAINAHFNDKELTESQCKELIGRTETYLKVINEILKKK